jgi:G protein beta subunit-like protein
MEAMLTNGIGFQRDYQSKAGISSVVLHPNQGELISGGEDGSIRVWDLTANSCYELVPDGKVAIRSITVASDASMVLAANNRGTVFVWKLGKGIGKRSYHHITMCPHLLSS